MRFPRSGPGGAERVYTDGETEAQRGAGLGLRSPPRSGAKSIETHMSSTRCTLPPSRAPEEDTTTDGTDEQVVPDDGVSHPTQDGEAEGEVFCVTM